MSFVARNHVQQVATRGALDAVDDRETPSELFDELSAKYGPFDLDVAAAPHNAKCERFYTLQDNALVLPWDGKVWCNPPYSNLMAWMEKAWEERDAGRAQRLVMLLPANRTEQPWWQDYVEPYRDGLAEHGPWTRFLRGRTRFIQAGQTTIKPNERPPFGCVVLAWDTLS